MKKEYYNDHFKQDIQDYVNDGHSYKISYYKAIDMYRKWDNRKRPFPKDYETSSSYIDNHKVNSSFSMDLDDIINKAYKTACEALELENVNFKEINCSDF